jgi:hypothetical protein
MKKEESEKLEEVRKYLNKQLEQIAGDIGHLLKPLRALKEEQIGAVVGFGYLMQVIPLVRNTRALDSDLGKRLLGSIEKELAAISSNLRSLVTDAPVLAHDPFRAINCDDLQEEYDRYFANCERARASGEHWTPDCLRAIQSGALLWLCRHGWRLYR